jgi:hypothetical protein
LSRDSVVRDVRFLDGRTGDIGAAVQDQTPEPMEDVFARALSTASVVAALRDGE